MFLIVGGLLGAASAKLWPAPIYRRGGLWVWLFPTLYFLLCLLVEMFNGIDYVGKPSVLHAYKDNVTVLMATLPAAASIGYSLGVLICVWLCRRSEKST